MQQRAEQLLAASGYSRGRRRTPPRSAEGARSTRPWRPGHSGGFTELSIHGRWVTAAAAYVEAVDMYAERIGRMDFAAPQEWMCEPVMIKRTGLSVHEH
jgi:hypothetical protein